MTSPIFRPAPPVPATWTPQGGWPSSSTGRSRLVMTQNGPISLPGDFTEDEVKQYVQAYDQYIAKLTTAWEQSSGIQRTQIESQIADAKKARQNEIDIANLQAQTSRYGTDVQRQTAMAQLLENRRQFDTNHGLEMQRLGLDRAKTATDYLATPDRYITGSRFLNLSGRVLAGQPGSAPYGAVGEPQAKTLGDFAVLESGGNPGRSLNPSTAAASGGAGADKRVAALNAVMRAIPPSQGDGLDSGDFAVLNAAHAIYNSNLRPDQINSFRSDDESRGVLFDAGKNLGYSPQTWWKDQMRSRPGQGSARSA